MSTVRIFNMDIKKVCGNFGKHSWLGSVPSVINLVEECFAVEKECEPLENQSRGIHGQWKS